jgi:homoserine kinase type II
MAVYTELSRNEIEGLLQNYAIGELNAFHPIAAGIENTNYFIDCDISGEIKRFVLTVFEARVNHAELPFFIDLTEHFAYHNIPCPKFLRAKNGVALAKIKGKDCAIVEFLTGSPVENPTLENYAELGRMNAKLHLAAQDFKQNKKNDYALQKWVSIFAEIGTRADEIEAGLKDLITDELYYLADKWPFALPSGVVHTDLFPDNIFFQQYHLSGVIDFYFACNDSYAYDLAITINAWSIHNDAKKTQSFMDGYNAIRQLTNIEIEHMNTLHRGACMRFLITRLYDWFNTPEGALVNRKNPQEYLDKLKYWQNKL